ncbi:MAG: hypothetical protein ABEH58_00310 [Haloplanus sp.]
MSTERAVWALLLAAVPAALALTLSPPNVYARLVVGLGAFVAAFPASYLLAGVRV